MPEPFKTAVHAAVAFRVGGLPLPKIRMAKDFISLGEVASRGAATLEICWGRCDRLCMPRDLIEKLF